MKQNEYVKPEIVDYGTLLELTEESVYWHSAGGGEHSTPSRY
jgi:hypothetical protein